VIESLTDKNNVSACSQELPQPFNAFLIELRAKHIVEVLLAEQVEPVLADTAQKSVKNAGGEDTIGGVKERPEEGGYGYGAAPGPSLGEGLCVPGKERHWTHGSKVQERALNTPIGRFTAADLG
jgi:hypothetical protein